MIQALLLRHSLQQSHNKGLYYGVQPEEHGKTVKYRITSITPVLQGFADFFSISLVFSMFVTLALVEVKEYESEKEN